MFHPHGLQAALPPVLPPTSPTLLLPSHKLSSGSAAAQSSEHRRQRGKGPPATESCAFSA